MNPDSAVAYAARAGIEKERQMFSLAENDYEAASQRDPLNVDYRVNRVELLLLLKNQKRHVPNLTFCQNKASLKVY